MVRLHVLCIHKLYPIDKLASCRSSSLCVHFANINKSYLYKAHALIQTLLYGSAIAI